MFDEFLSGGVFIKIKIKGSLKNITENEEYKIDTTAIKNKDTISYLKDNTKYKLKIKDTLTLIRETDEFIHYMEFIKNKKIETKYYIKSLNSELSIEITTDKLDISDNYLLIEYTTIENNNKYIYKLEMSDDL